MLEKIKDFFLTLLSKRKILFDLLDEYEDYVRGVDVCERNTLLGAMRNAEQYGINLKYNFYHVPAEAVDTPEKVKFIALYRSKNFFDGNDPGVIHYGKVISYEKLKRRDIKELMLNFSPEAYYYRFNVEKWNTLLNPVKAREIAPTVCYMTNFHILNNSRYVYELYLESNNEVKLSLAIRDTVSKVHDGFFMENTRVFTAFSRIIVLSPKGSFFFKIKDYKRYPRETFVKIKGIVFNDK